MARWLAGRLWLPLWVTNWLTRYCVRCDKITWTWHYRSCPCVVLMPEPGSPLHDALTQLQARKEADGG